MITQYIDLEHRRYNVVILCGGLGSRLGAQSQYIPKAMSSFGESIAINVIIEQYQNVAHKYVIGTSTHAHLLEAHIRGCYPNLNVEFSREHDLINTLQSFMLALDHVDSRYPTILQYCDAIQLGNPIIEPDIIYGVDGRTAGHTNTYRYNTDFTEFATPQKTGMFPMWVFGNTILLKRETYSNPCLGDCVKIIENYNSFTKMNPTRVKMCVEFGTEADLQEVRKIWQTI